MKGLLLLFVVVALSVAANPASALPGTFRIDEIYSNADGTVQFVVIHDRGMNDCDSGEDRWAGQPLTSSGADPQRVFIFPHDLSTCQTSGKDILIATQGFAALDLVAPDYVIPNGFMQIPSGSLNFAGVNTLSYTALPNDGVHALNHLGQTVQNVATNFAGVSASVSGSPAAANYQGIWYKAPANSEAGWGINLAHQGDKIFASWFTYDTTGHGWWLVMTADKTAPNTYTGKLYQTRGPAFNAVPFDPNAVAATEAGTGTLTFTDANNGTFAYVVGGVSQAKAITRQVFGTLPTCSTATGSLALATNYQDLWWKTPGGSESGWGINLNHQGDQIFATWFTYDIDGSPMWLVVTAPKSSPGMYSGDLYRTTGPAFSAVPFDPSKVVPTKVGTATFTFADGNNATFTYTVQLTGMAGPVTQAKALTRELFSTSGTICQ